MEEEVRVKGKVKVGMRELGNEGIREKGKIRRRRLVEVSRF
jgi:hypothetical protein